MAGILIGIFLGATVTTQIDERTYSSEEPCKDFDHVELRETQASSTNTSFLIYIIITLCYNMPYLLNLKAGVLCVIHIRKSKNKTEKALRKP